MKDYMGCFTRGFGRRLRGKVPSGSVEFLETEVFDIG
jgi:hypothetical protein